MGIGSVMWLCGRIMDASVWNVWNLLIDINKCIENFLLFDCVNWMTRRTNSLLSPSPATF